MKRSSFKPFLSPAAIGSLPFSEPERAVEKVFEFLPQIPFWPQLPKRSFREQMIAQFSSGLGFLQVNERGITLKEDLSSLEESLAAAIEKRDDYFSLSPEYAAGFFQFLNYLKKNPGLEFKALKGQITGPFTFASGINASGKNILFDPSLMEAIVLALALNARWQIRQLSEFKKPCLMFIDEPYLACFGSGFTPVTRNQVIDTVNKLVAGIDSAQSLIGLHCCANTDWSMCLESDIDIISFDAYSFFQRFSLYPQQIKAFLSKGGLIAWGIVPTSEYRADITIQDICKAFHSAFDILVNKGIDKELLIERSLLTPSCGMGSLSDESCLGVFKLLVESSDALKSDFKLK